MLYIQFKSVSIYLHSCLQLQLSFSSSILFFTSSTHVSSCVKMETIVSFPYFSLYDYLLHIPMFKVVLGQN